jgi:hypothetical protein
MNCIFLKFTEDPINYSFKIKKLTRKKYCGAAKELNQTECNEGILESAIW